MADINFKLRIKTKAKKQAKRQPKKKRTKKEGGLKDKFIIKPENILLKAHNPGLGNPINPNIAHQTPLVIERPNLEQANRVNLINELVQNQTKTLQDNEVKVTSLIDDVKKEEKKINDRLEEVLKRSYIDERNRLKEEYQKLGGDDPIILNSTRKPTIINAINDLKLKKTLPSFVGQSPSTLADLFDIPPQEQTLADIYQSPATKEQTIITENPKTTNQKKTMVTRQSTQKTVNEMFGKKSPLLQPKFK
jgi:hypothetical protein